MIAGATGTGKTRTLQVIAEQAAHGQEWVSRAAVTEFFSLGGQGEGAPIRTTMSNYGPVLMSKVLELNETQESSLGLIFHYADRNAPALLDRKDPRTAPESSHASSCQVSPRGPLCSPPS